MNAMPAPRPKSIPTMVSCPAVRRRVFPIAALLTVMLSSGGPAIAQSTNSQFAGFLAEASQRFGLPAAWIEAVIAAESAGDSHAVSPKGAMGLMQLMPGTWAMMRDRLGLGNDPFEPRANILAGTAFLREMHDRYGSPGFLAAYNAGPGRYENHLATGRPLPAETRAYLALLAPRLGGEPANGTVTLPPDRPWTAAPLFISRTTGANSVPPASRRTTESSADISAIIPRPDGLFVALSMAGGRR